MSKIYPPRFNDLDIVYILCASICGVTGLLVGPFCLMVNGGVFEYQIVNLLVGVVGGWFLCGLAGLIFGYFLAWVIFLLIKPYFALFRRTPTSLQEFTK